MKQRTGSNEKLPNFLIVGAGKSGTTSISKYLSEHPDIYMPPHHKEPRFLVHENIPYKKAENEQCAIQYYERTVRTLEEYRALFDGVKNERAVGEASMAYLNSPDLAIRRIRELLGEVKIIIILRQPADRAFSSYMHQVRELNEPYSFEAALEREAYRMRENYIPGYEYASKGFYHRDVKAYLDAFKEVKIILFEDLQNSPETVMRDLYQFLGVDPSYCPQRLHRRYNISGRPKSGILQYLIYHDTMIKMFYRHFIKPLLPVQARERVKGMNLRRERIRPETRRRLTERYREDIEALSALIGRDLSHWLK